MKRQINELLNLALYATAIGVLVAAGVAGYSDSSEHAVGLTLIAGGVGLIAFARFLTLKHQREVTQVISSFWKEVLPTVLMLWGMGGVIVGILQTWRLA